MIVALTILGGLVGLGGAAFLAVHHGTYRWLEDSKHGPAPVFAIVLRERGVDWVRFEVVVAGRALWMDWGRGW